ncbi:MAG: ATP-binding cassette domain-containing protein [Proteobacteria bacterium]|nr:ATP-binding cassette domain-containing protein [Pseudomonadota bacterium]
MIQINNLSKSFSGIPLFQSISFSVGKNEIIGLVGRNGSGKSTLFKIILGVESYDSGDINTPKTYKLGYLDQHIHFTKKTLIEECCQVLGEDEQYDHYKAEKILFGLGFTESDLTLSPSKFSGGFQLRINLTKTLLQDPDMLLLDEPTNYLDLLSLRWLRRFLKSFRGEAILITHDRAFLDTVTTHTMGIHRGLLTKVKGDTNKYYTQLLVDEEVHEKTRVNQEKKIKDLQKFADKFGAKASKATQAKSKLRQIEKMEVLTQIKQEHKLGFRFNYRATPAKTFLSVDDIAFSYTGLKADNLFEKLSFHIGPKDRLAVIGKNGKGKTTLLNALAGAVSPTSGLVTFNPNATLGYYQQTNRKNLVQTNTVAEEIAQANPHLSISESRGICGAMMFSGTAGDKKISVLSGGEQSRVLLGKILAHPSNLLFLDEPSNHLDMDSITILTDEVSKFKGGLVIVTHNEEMLRKLANKLIIFHKGGAEFFHGTYDEFLESIGWEEEASLKKPKTKSGNKDSAESKATSSGAESHRAIEIKKECKQVERKIERLEEYIENKNRSVDKILNDITATKELEKLYKNITELQSQVDNSYAKMEGLLKELDSMQAKC